MKVFGKSLGLTRWEAVSVAAIFLVLLSALVGRSMAKPLSHDEHQFIASGALWAARGLVPYHDFPYFHMPYLVYLYGLLFRYCSHLLLTARLVSVLCAWLCLFVVFAASLNAFRRVGKERVWLAIGAMLLLFFNPLFAYTSAWAWNHAASFLPLLLAVVVHQRAFHDPRKLRLLFVSGFLVGVSTGVRLSTAPMVVPFLLTIAWMGGQGQERPVGWWWRFAAAFCAGLVMALLPAALLFVQAPERFLFGNFGYPLLFRQYHETLPTAADVTLAARLRYFAAHVISMPGNVLETMALLIFGSATFVRLWRDRRHTDGIRELLFVLLLLPFAFMGALAMAPSSPQYYMVTMMLAVLGAVYGMSSCLAASGVPSCSSLRQFALIVAAVALVGLPLYREIGILIHPREWIPVRVHQLGLTVGRLAAGRTVLTIAPIYPVEGGADIFESMVEGSLAWRLTYLLSKERRVAYRLIQAEDLDEEVAGRRVAVLTGTERPDLEVELAQFAHRAGFVPTAISSSTLVLYLPPGTTALTAQ